MNKWWWVVIVALGLSIAFSFYRGNRVMAKRSKILNNTGDDFSQEELTPLSYHGGMPNMPKPQKLNMALSDAAEYLLFFNTKGEQERIYYKDCHKVEKIVTRHDPDMKGKSVVLWGPLIGFLVKVKFRYYIVIGYTDCTNNNNNILLECDEKDHKALFEQMRRRIPSFRT